MTNSEYVYNGSETSNFAKTLILLEAKLMQLNAPTSTADPEIMKRNNEMLAKQKANEEQ